MARRRFIHDGQGLVEVERAPRRPRIAIHGDTTEPFRSMADGKHYDSKSRYRAELRARGFEEVGNERGEFDPRPPAPEPVLPDLIQTASELGI